MNNVSQKATNTDADRRKLTCRHCKKLGHYRNQFCLLKRQKKQTENTQRILDTKTVAPLTLSRFTTITIITATTTRAVTELQEIQKLLTYPVRHAGNQTFSQRKVILLPMQLIDHPPSTPGTKDRKDRIRSNKETIKTIQREVLKLQPKI